MDKDRIKELAHLLTDFIASANKGDNASLYGKKMDVAVATDLLSILLAYGLDYQTYLTLKAHLKVLEAAEIAAIEANDEGQCYSNASKEM